MRTLILAALATVVTGATAATASAQDRPRLFGRRLVDSPSQNTRYLPPPKYPRLAAFAQPYGPFQRPGYVLPGVYNERPLARVLPLAFQSVMFVISFVDPTPLYVVGNALPPAIRVAHVALNGTPTPGQPGQTLLFILNPWLAEARARVGQGKGLINGKADGWVSPQNPYVGGGGVYYYP